MASAWYSTGIKALMDGDVDLLVDDIRAVLIDSADYTPDLAAHDFLNDVAAGARVGTATALASKTTTVATNVITFDAADTTLSAVTGDQSEQVLIYKHTGVESTSQLLLLLDLTAAVTPNGGDITLQWNASGIGTITR